MKIKFKKLHPDAKMPTRANKTDAGYDLFSTEDGILMPLQRRLFKIGIAAAIPEGYYGRVAPRSGLALKRGLDIMAGVIDSGYRNEIGVILINLNRDVFEMIEIKTGDRIAQLIIEKCHDAKFEEVENLDETERGAGGFGSTGQ